MGDLEEWERIAADYSVSLMGVNNDGAQVFAQATNAAIVRRLPTAREARVLELGCGDGTLLAELSGRYDCTIGFDGSRRMIGLAKIRNSPALAGYVVGNAMQPLPFATGSFDVVLSNMVLMCLEEVDSVFAEVSRLLTAGGVFLFTINHPCFTYTRHHLARGETRYLEHFATAKRFAGAAGPVFRNYNRPLHYYVNQLRHCALSLQGFEEIAIPSANDADGATCERII